MDDTTFIIEPFSSPAWLEYIGQRNVKTKEKAENYLQSGPFKTYRENGFGLWLVEKRQRRGYRHVWDNEVGRVRNPDIGFAFLPGHSGKS